MTKLAVVSDIHGQWADLDYPSADVLVFAGDVLGNYAWDKDEDAARQLPELGRFNERLGELKRQGVYQEIVVIAGNHDKCYDRREPDCRSVLTNATYLQDESAAILGRKFYGSPWSPWFGGHVWSFNFPCGDPMDGGNPAQARAHARRIWGRIPEETEILITHGPPYGMRDACNDGRRVGCPELTARVRQLPALKLHVFGHIHPSRGQSMLKIDDRKVLCVNASMLTDDLKQQGPVQVVEI